MGARDRVETAVVEPCSLSLIIDLRTVQNETDCRIASGDESGRVIVRCAWVRSATSVLPSLAIFTETKIG